MTSSVFLGHNCILEISGNYKSTSGTEFAEDVFRKTCLLMAFLFFLPWLLIFIPLFANEDVDWYKDALWEGNM